MLGTTDCSASDIEYTKSVSPSNPTSGSPSIPLVSFDNSRLLPDQTPNPDFLQFSIETSDVTLAATTYTVTLTGKITTVDSSGAPVVTKKTVSFDVYVYPSCSDAQDSPISLFDPDTDYPLSSERYILCSAPLQIEASLLTVTGTSFCD